MKFRVTAHIALLFLVSPSVSMAGDEQHCASVGQLAARFAEARGYGQTYSGAIQSIDEGMRASDLSADDRASMKRDMYVTARWVYKDSPKLTPEGARRLMYVMCMANDLK